MRFLREIRQLISREDRKQWPLLLTLSLVAGLSRSLFLALLNETIAGSTGEGFDLWALGGSIGLLALILGGSYFASIGGRRVAARVGIRIRNRLLDDIGSANLHLLERIGVNSLHHHLMHTTGMIANGYGVMLAFGASVVTLLFNLIYIGWLSPLGLLLGMAIMLVGVLVHFLFERRNIPHRQRLEALFRDITGVHRNYLEGYKELRLSRAKHDQYRARIDEVNREAFDEELAEEHVSAAGRLIAKTFEYSMMLAIVFLLPVVVDTEAVLLLQLLTAVLFTMGPLDSAVGAFPRFIQTQVSLDNYRNIQAQVAEICENAARESEQPLPAVQSIGLRDVTFGFPGEEGFRLGPIDLQLHSGEVAFLIGGNGAGKTVLLRLLTGLYRPQGGEVLVNGQAVDERQRQAYREQFATIYGDFFLFKLLLGHPSIDPGRVNALLEEYDLAHKTRFVDGQFSTTELSAGQRKRLAYVVALLDDRPIYVLDEFAAEQDPEHRRRFYHEWLPALKAAGKMLVVVSHDDEFFHLADRLIKLDKGGIVSQQLSEPQMERIR